MWHRPQLMTAIADLLMAAAAAVVFVAGVVWVTRLPVFVLSEVVVANELATVRRSDLERALAGQLNGNFFSVNLEAVRQSVERIAWVRRAQVRRQWPSRLEIAIEEHVARAQWGEEPGHLVNAHGEVFAALPPPGGGLPVLHGPAGSAPEVLRRYAEFLAALAPIGRQPTHVILSPRLAWQVRLDDGLVVELGREQQRMPVASRLARFVAYYPGVRRDRRPRPVAVDMRYPNGFALRLAAVGGDGKGK